MTAFQKALATIQKADQNVLQAKVEIQKIVDEFAKKVSASIGLNAYSIANDNLFESWKSSARVLQKLSTIEAELKGISQETSGLASFDQTEILVVPALEAPNAVSRGVKASSEAPTDVKIKRQKAIKVAKYKVKAKIHKAVKAKTEGLPVLQGNPAKLLAFLKKKLNDTGYQKFSLVDVTQKTGLPTGSITAATVKLVELGFINGDRNIGYKLNQSSAPVVKASAVKIEAVKGNAAILLAHLEKTLNTSEFSQIHQTATAKESKIPLGSMTSSLRRLVQVGSLIANGSGGYKLGASAQ